MKSTIQPWRLRLIMVLATTPVLVGTLFSFYTWSSRANQTYRYPYIALAVNTGNRSLLNEIDFYSERIRRNPSDGLERAALASAYLKLARSTGDASYYQLAEESAQQSLVNLPVNNIEAQLVLARVAEAKHDFPTTIEIAQQVQQKQPTNPDAQTLMVTSHLAVGKLSEASQFAQRLVEQTPTLGTFTLRALVHAAQGQDEQAVRAFQQALAAEEPGEVASSAKTRTLLGRFYAQRGQLSLARELYQEALRIVPRYPFARLELAKLETQQGNYQQAEALYAQISATPLSANVFDHEAAQGQALLKLLQGERNTANQLWAKAEQDFRNHHAHRKPHEHHHTQETEHDHDREHEEAHDRHHEQEEHDHYHLQAFGHRRELARLLLTRGRAADVPEALELMQAEVQIRRDAETLETLAWALQQNGRVQSAQKVLQEAMALGTRDAKLFYRAGVVERSLGNQQRARTYFQMAQDINPNFDVRLRQLWGLG